MQPIRKGSECFEEVLNFGDARWARICAVPGVEVPRIEEESERRVSILVTR